MQCDAVCGTDGKALQVLCCFSLVGLVFVRDQINWTPSIDNTRPLWPHLSHLSPLSLTLVYRYLPKYGTAC